MSEENSKPTIVVLVGLPASGKSTVAYRYRAAGYVRINYDDLRKMGFGEYDWFKDKIIYEPARAMAVAALNAGFNVVIDNTNIKQFHIDSWKTVAEETNAMFEVEYIDTPISVCLQRNATRERGTMGVPDSVIINMAKNSDVDRIQRLYSKYLKRERLTYV
jgi:predicted kinase